MPGREPNQFFGHSLQGVKNFQKPPQIEDEVDLLRKGRGDLDDTFPVPDEAFMALELVQGVLDDIDGVVRFPQPFLNAM